MIAKNNRSMLGVGLALLISATTAYGQCPPGEVQINGEVYEGTGTVTYTLNAVGESIAHRNAVLAPLAPPLTPAANDVRVMIQNMDGGAFVAYGTFAPASNGWSACVPEGGSYIAMFSATGHDLTSRVYDVPLGYVAPAVVPQSYLPALHLNIDTGVVNAATEPMQPLGNVLVYAFEENMVNGAPDWPMDPGLPGVFMELYDPRTGVVVSSGYTIDGNGGPTAITTKDGLVFGGQMAAGHLYMQDIPPGEYRLRATPPNALDANGNAWTGGWYHTYTMEGTQEWEILIYPGDPGTEAGGFMAWFGFVKKVGQIATTVPGSTISGTLQDADVAFEVPIAGEPPEAGAPLDPAYRNQGVFPNGPIPDGFLVLWRLIGNTPELIATTDADPVTGAFSINNVPAGQYYIFFVDKPLNYIFGEMNFTVDGINPLVLPPITQEIPGAPLAISARFFARVQGFVVDDATGIGIGGATVNIRYRAGNVPFSTVTEPNGWYNFDALPEIETMAMIDVEPPPGYRGSFVTDTYFPTAAVPPDPNCTGFPNCPLVPTPCDPTVDPTCVVPGASLAVQRNGMGRYVQWYTANYKSDLILEPVPATAGHVQGLVFNDSLATGTWVADGIYDKAEEPVVEGAVIQLLDATGGIIPLIDAVTGLPVVDPITGLPVQDPATVSASGAYDKAGAVAQGYILPGISVPPDEWGGFFSGPMPGFYEFRDVAPGTYTVRLTLPAGFHAAAEAIDPLTGLSLGYVDQTVVVAGGARNDVNFGINTLVPQAGQLEGGVFDDQLLDTRWYSAFSEEKALLVGLGVTVRDYLGYQTDLLVQPSGLCYPGTTPYDPTQPQVPYGAICDRPDLGNSVEIDRLVAPGLRLYYGNDPALPVCDANAMNSPCHDPTKFTLELPYTMGQGTTKYEADWSLPAAILPPGTPPPVDCAAAIYLDSLSGGSNSTEGTKWSASVAVVVNDPLGPLPGALVSAVWSTGAESTAITNQNGLANLILETVENTAINSVTATISVTAPEGGGGVFAPTCGAGNCLEISSPAAGGMTGPCAAATFCGDGTCDAGEDWCACPTDCVATDTDGDGVPNCADICPNDPLKTTAAGPCGCGNLDTDTDLDGTPDCLDLCPNDDTTCSAPIVYKSDPGQCGCCVAEGMCGCVPSGFIIAGLNANAIDMGEQKWRIEITATINDGNCGTPAALAAGDKIWFTFGNGESKKVVADGQSTSFLIKSETIEGGGPSLVFTIDNVDNPAYDAGFSVTSVTVNRPF